MERAVNHYNDLVGELREDVEKAVSEYNEAVERARDFSSEVAVNFEVEIADKSEKWQEGERGQAAAEMQQEWDGASFDEYVIEFPDELAFDDPEYASTLENLPEEPAA